MSRARSIRPGFAPTDGDADIVRVCRLLCGLPLAVELATSRLAGLGMREILGQLTDQLRFLRSTTAGTGLAGPDENRHASLWATLVWSAELLSEGARTTLACLSVG